MVIPVIDRASPNSPDQMSVSGRSIAAGRPTIGSPVGSAAATGLDGGGAAGVGTGSDPGSDSAASGSIDNGAAGIRGRCAGTGACGLGLAWLDRGAVACELSG
jgi:hypothetical protein